MKAPAQLAAIGLLALGACESPGEPKDPIWGKQACGACSMLVSEPQHAAQLVTKEETRVYFDDVGCMAAYVLERNLSPPKMWVRDPAGSWVDARTAKFKSGAKTPMDFGYSYSKEGDGTFADVQLAAKRRAERR